jgi:yjeF N-terminal region
VKLFLINMYCLIDARILDKNAEYLGLNMEKLMENAGKAVADVVLSLKPKNVLVVCGSGNNGGDGYVTAINLKKNGVNVDVYMAKMPKSQLCIKKYNEAKEEGANIVNFFDPSKYDVIVDAMLGIGIEKDPEEPYRSLIEKINVSGKTIVSVDVPTGIGTNVSIKPDITVGRLGPLCNSVKGR